MTFDPIKFQIGIGVTVLLLIIGIIIVAAINLSKTINIESDKDNGNNDGKININGQKIVLSWTQDESNEKRLTINSNVNRAVLVPCEQITNQETDAFLLDTETGIMTYKGAPRLTVNLNYRITLQLPSSDSKVMNHFISKNANSSWNLVNPFPTISIAANQSPLTTTINASNELTVTTLTLITSLQLVNGDTFGLCTNQQSTNNLTIYKNVACQVFV